MNNPLSRLVLGAATVLIIGGCDQNSGNNSMQTGENNEGILMDTAAHINTHRKQSEKVLVHAVVVEEVLQTSSYVYLYVKEGEKKFWISTSKREVKPGEDYLFHDVMLQTNFKSKELDRTFDTLYLVSTIVPINSNNKTQSDMGSTSNNDSPLNTEGSIKIAELVKNKATYSGKMVQLSGVCVKINKSIMGRNWIHLQDGSMDSYDLVITSDMVVPVGNRVTMTGVVALDKDFGASYQYELIIEEGKIVQ